MKLYNTMTRQKETFVPIEPGKVRMYSCGPTVYDFFHIGNARPFITFDVLRQYLEYRGYEVKFVQNFTDIDDRMIQKSQEAKMSLRDFADQFIHEYEIDAKGLGIRPATVHPRATDSMEDIIVLIKTLIEKGYAYEVEGDVYYKAHSFEGYGKLSHYKIDDLEAGARVGVDERKHDSVDFALWKAQKPGEPAWESPWGMGRPGWHIECSAMAGRHLGETIDIHSGGLDLIFPHHENEIAQSEAATGKTFANYWLHNGFININNEKMSKSTGPLFRVRDIIQHFEYEIVRFFILSAHYRSPINFSEELLESTKSGLDRMYECRDQIRFLLKRKGLIQDTMEGSEKEGNLFSIYKNRFIDAMDDDLNTADAVSVLFDLVRAVNIHIAEEANKAQDGSKDISVEQSNQEFVSYLQAALDMLMELSGVLGLLRREEESTDSAVEALIEKRQLARTEKNWKESDRIRDQLKDMGIEIKDTPDGVRWVKVGK